ncbi:hypothetical protein ACUN24_20535 [Pedobacter sp. WC2501]|uniref:hypothetical protein n=1 Tax=Pedobacter sp. WC2501 TaxID=3461400 RepID=UPI00404543D3
MIEPTDYSKLISAFAAISSAIIAIVNFRSAGRRAKLKDDLEIFKRLKEASPADSAPYNDTYDDIERKIRKGLDEIYVNKGVDKSDFFSAVLMALLVALPWSQAPKSVIYEYRMFFTIVFSAMCVWFIVSIIRKRKLPRQSPENLEVAKHR